MEEHYKEALKYYESTATQLAETDLQRVNKTWDRLSDMIQMILTLPMDGSIPEHVIRDFERGIETLHQSVLLLRENVSALFGCNYIAWKAEQLANENESNDN